MENILDCIGTKLSNMTKEVMLFAQSFKTLSTSLTKIKESTTGMFNDRNFLFSDFSVTSILCLKKLEN